MFRGSLVPGEKFDLESLRVFGFVKSGLNGWNFKFRYKFLEIAIFGNFANFWNRCK